MALKAGIQLSVDSKGNLKVIDLVRGDVRKLNAETKRSTRELKKMRLQSEANAKSLKRFGDKAKFAGIALLSAFGAASLAVIAQRADQIRLLESRIQRVTAVTNDYSLVMQDLTTIAFDNGVALKGTADLFINIQRSAKDLGASNASALQLTNTVQQLGVISGASSEAMKNSLRQLSQAFAGNIFRAEEWNSVVENTPEIANRIAQGMGKTVGEVRKMVVAGELLSKDVFEVLLKQSNDIQKDFEQMPLTMDRATNRLGLNFDRLLDSINDSTGATAALADLINDVALNLGEAADYISSGELEADFSTWIEFADDIGEVTDNLVTLLDWFNEFDERVDESAVGFNDVLLDFPVWAKSAFQSIIAEAEYSLQWIISNYKILDLKLGKVWTNIEKSAAAMWGFIKISSAEATQFISLQFSGLLTNIASGMEKVPFLASKASAIMKAAGDIAVGSNNLVKQAVAASAEQQQKYTAVIRANNIEILKEKVVLAQAAQARDVVILAANKAVVAAKEERQARKELTAEMNKAEKQFDALDREYRKVTSGTKSHTKATKLNSKAANEAEKAAKKLAKERDKAAAKVQKYKDLVLSENVALDKRILLIGKNELAAFKLGLEHKKLKKADIDALVIKKKYELSLIKEIKTREKLNTEYKTALKLVTDLEKSNKKELVFLKSGARGVLQLTDAYKKLNDIDKKRSLKALRDRQGFETKGILDQINLQRKVLNIRFNQGDAAAELFRIDAEILNNTRKLGDKNAQAINQAERKLFFENEQNKAIEKRRKLYDDIYSNILSSIKNGDAPLSNLSGTLIDAGKNSGNPIVSAFAKGAEILGAVLSNKLTESEIKLAIGQTEFNDDSINSLISLTKDTQYPMLDLTKKMSSSLLSMDRNFGVVAKGIGLGSGIDISGANFTPQFSSKLGGALSTSSSTLLGSGLQFDKQDLSDALKGIKAQSVTTTKESDSFLFGLFSSEKIKTSFKSLNDETLAALTETLNIGVDLITSSAETLGVSIQDQLDGIFFEGKYDFTGLGQEEIQKRLSNIFSELFSDITSLTNLDELTERYSKFGETSFETLGRIALEYEQASYAIGLTGKTIAQGGAEIALYTDNLKISLLKGKISFDAYASAIDRINNKIANSATAQEQVLNIVEASGGLDAFNSNMSDFVNNFYSDAEKLKQQQDALSLSFKSLGVAMPETNSEFRELVNGINVTTKAGADLYAGLLSLSGSFATVEKQEEAFAKQRIAEQKELNKKLGTGREKWLDKLLTDAEKENRVRTLNQIKIKEYNETLGLEGGFRVSNINTLTRHIQALQNQGEASKEQLLLAYDLSDAIFAENTARLDTIAVLDAETQRIQNLNATWNDTSGVLQYINASTISAREGLVGFAGGLDQFTGLVNGYVNDILNADEQAIFKQTQAAQSLSQLASDLNIDASLLDTRDEFKALVADANSATALSTELGQETLVRLLGASRSVALLADSGKTLTDVLTNAPADMLNFSSPFQEATDKFNDLANNAFPSVVDQSEEIADNFNNIVPLDIKRATYEATYEAQEKANEALIRAIEKSDRESAENNNRLIRAVESNNTLVDDRIAQRRA